MSADTYHHLVEKAMCEVKNVYDYRDFVSFLEKSGVALELNSLIFFEIPRGLSESKRTRNKPKLDNVCVVRFVRGSTHIFWKESIDAGKSKSSESLTRYFLGCCFQLCTQMDFEVYRSAEKMIF